MYKAVELCAFELYDDVDYDTWYQTQLLRELQIHDPRSEVEVPPYIIMRGVASHGGRGLTKLHRL